MDDETRLTIIVAVAENGVIGMAGDLPWRLPSDLKRFRKLTMGKPIVMGRKTFAAIGKALDGRDNIVVSRDPDFHAEGAVVANDLARAIEIARECAHERGVDEICVIGGAQIYAQVLSFTDSIELTRVHGVPGGDSFFPSIEDDEWREISRERHSAAPGDSADYSFIRLDRRR